MLHDDAAHFNRLVTCSRCGREVPGRAVLGPADLDLPAPAVVCADCVEAATGPGPAAPAAPGEPGPADEPAVAGAPVELDRGTVGPDEQAGDAVTGDAVTGDAVEEPDRRPAGSAPAPGEDGNAAASGPGEAGAGIGSHQLPAGATPDPDPGELPANGTPDAGIDAGAGEPDLAGPGEPDVAAAEPDARSDDAPGEHDARSDEAPGEHDARSDEAPADDAPAATVPDAGGAVPAWKAPEPASSDDLRIAGLERRLIEAVDRLTRWAEAQAERQAGVQARVEELGSALAAVQAQRSDKLRRQVDGLADRVGALQGTIDAEWARAKAEAAALGKADERLVATVSKLEARIAELAGQVAATADAGVERSSALDRQVGEAVAGLRSDLADLRAAMPAPAPDADPRLRAVETQVRRNRAEVADLNELHAALDAGLGELRGEIGGLRSGIARLGDSKADLEDRLETFVRASLVPDDQKGRKAKKAAESTLGTLSAAVDDLLREQRQIRDQIDELGATTDAATAAAARAVTQASSLGPIRSEMKLLHQEMLEQNEVLDALRRTVEGLRRPAPATATKAPATGAPAARAPAAPATTTKVPATTGKSPDTAKAPPATGAPATRASPARRAAAKAALARAAAAPAKAAPPAKAPSPAAPAKAAPPAAKRVPRARKPGS